MFVEFKNQFGDHRVILRLPHPASEDPIEVEMIMEGVIHYQRTVSCIYIEIAEFALEASSLEEGSTGKSSFSSLEDDFVILCRSRQGDRLLLEFSLDDEPSSGEWTASTAFEVPVETMASIGSEVSAWVKQC